MNSPFSYSSTFTLDKQYLAECYDETANINRSFRAYIRSIIFIVLGLLLLQFFQIDTYMAIFIMIVGVVDAAGVYYHKPWWLARQALGSTYKGEVTLTINEAGIVTQTHQTDTVLTWTDITKVQQTSLGLLVIHSKGRNYLSKQTLAKPAIDYILSRMALN